MKRRKRKGNRRGGTGLGWFSRGIRDGANWRTRFRGRPDARTAAEAAHRSWSLIARKPGGRRRPWPAALRDGKRYVSGFWRGSGVRGQLIPVPLQGSAAAVLYAPRNASLLRGALRRLRRLPLREIVVLLPGDSSLALIAAARTQPNVMIAYRPDLADSDVGRALGARITQADSVLFLDGGRPLKAERLARFLWACDNGLDIALNDVTGKLGLFHTRQNVFRLAEFLNRTMNRRDLRANSLSSLPFALSRRALDRLVPGPLAHPAQAQVIAMYSGLRVGIAGAVRPAIPSDTADRTGKAVREHAEAWRTALRHKGSRLLFPDTVRNRKLLEGWT
ncbi:hypothetical protein GE107_15075 [Cohnella sp. CFH 77786]|uniref:hypothetical protein n=1 Tax=Cohnella sp. CFH 77786 TaxID=2662265 RepID=UPI001C60F291|nr:hypothetical protein [Cohnella sp. CFH 77786]MBW5447378.1 hypothetical protein [Cohnella sp. CFH 77786]